MNIKELFIIAVKQPVPHPAMRCTMTNDETLSFFCNIDSKNICVQVTKAGPSVSSFRMSDAFNVDLANDILSTIFDELTLTNDKELYIKRVLNSTVLFIDEDIYSDAFPKTRR